MEIGRPSCISPSRHASDVLEIGPEWRRFCWPRDRDAEAETGPEAVNLAAWGSESGRGPVRAEKIPGAERRGRQNFSFPTKTHPQKASVMVSKVPKAAYLLIKMENMVSKRNCHELLAGWCSSVLLKQEGKLKILMV